MSPHLIIILMLSMCALLLMLLFAVRKRAKKTSAPSSSPMANPIPDLSSLDLSSLQQSGASPSQQQPATKPSADLVELISRYRFFQGKNLQLFQDFFEQKDWSKIEQLIREKFQEQGKTDAFHLASNMTKKLLQN